VSERFRRGLVVGKFAPLHRGHELVIRRALAASDEVLIISYSKPEFPGCAPERRERWLEALFPRTRRLVLSDERLGHLLSASPEFTEVPANDADAATHRRFVGFLCASILRVDVDAVFTGEDYGRGFAHELTDYLRRHAAPHAVVRHVLVDRTLGEAAVSGTTIRRDVHAHRHWLAPEVYRSFVRRVCLVGGESSGKSTLAQALARSFETEHVREYGRELWVRRCGALTFDDLRRIAERQVALEEAAARRANRLLFCDTSPLTTLCYSQCLFGRADPVVERLADRQYDLCVLCAADFDFVQDGTRRGAAFRARQQAWYLEQLARRRVPWMLVTGGTEDRVAQVRERLDGT
jgi:HTH-type transcriptional regulator, transcriptional repressor of NAD biosynthesis genes